MGWRQSGLCCGSGSTAVTSEHGAAEVARVEQADERGLVEGGTAADVHHDGVALEAGETRAVQKANRRGRVRQRVDEEIGLAEGGVEIAEDRKSVV